MKSQISKINRTYYEEMGLIRYRFDFDETRKSNVWAIDFYCAFHSRDIGFFRVNLDEHLGDLKSLKKKYPKEWNLISKEFPEDFI